MITSYALEAMARDRQCRLRREADEHRTACRPRKARAVGGWFASLRTHVAAGAARRRDVRGTSAAPDPGARLTPAAWGRPARPLEGAAERLLRVVPDASSAGDDADIRRLEQLLREVHPPLREVTDRMAAEHVPEALVEE